MTRLLVIDLDNTACSTKVAKGGLDHVTGTPLTINVLQCPFLRATPGGLQGDTMRWPTQLLH